MKFRVTLKDPDGVYESLKDSAETWEKGVTGLEEEEHDDIVSARQARLDKIISKWFQYSEYVTLEIDTESETCIVKER